MKDQRLHKIFFLPQLGQGDENVTISKWLVDNKNYVEYDQPVLEVDTDKVNFEVCAHRVGIITTAFPIGEKTSIGDPLFRIDDIEEPKTEEELIDDFYDLEPEEQQTALKLKLPRI